MTAVLDLTAWRALGERIAALDPARHRELVAALELLALGVDLQLEAERELGADVGALAPAIAADRWTAAGYLLRERNRAYFDRLARRYADQVEALELLAGGGRAVACRRLHERS